jgi:hypothetical protein
VQFVHAGDIDWSAFIGRLLGDEGAISIELQDATFERTTSSGDSDGY